MKRELFLADNGTCIFILGRNILYVTCVVCVVQSGHLLIHVRSHNGECHKPPFGLLASKHKAKGDIKPDETLWKVVSQVICRHSIHAL